LSYCWHFILIVNNASLTIFIWVGDDYKELKYASVICWVIDHCNIGYDFFPEAHVHIFHSPKHAIINLYSCWILVLHVSGRDIRKVNCNEMFWEGIYQFSYEMYIGGGGVCNNTNSLIKACQDYGCPYVDNEVFLMKYSSCPNVYASLNKCEYLLLPNFTDYTMYLSVFSPRCKCFVHVILHIGKCASVKVMWTLSRDFHVKRASIVNPHEIFSL
jgi:hypothetical protein